MRHKATCLRTAETDWCPGELVRQPTAAGRGVIKALGQCAAVSACGGRTEVSERRAFGSAQTTDMPEEDIGHAPGT